MFPWEWQWPLAESRWELLLFYLNHGISEGTECHNVCVVIPALSVEPGGLDPRDGLGWELPIPSLSPVSHRICWAGNSELTQSQATAEYWQAGDGFVCWSSAHRRAEKIVNKHSLTSWIPFLWRKPGNAARSEALEEPHFHFMALWNFSK